MGSIRTTAQQLVSKSGSEMRFRDLGWKSRDAFEGLKNPLQKHPNN